MRPLLLLACLLLIGLIVPTWSAEVTSGKLAPLVKNKEGKEQPQNVPGAFHPYNVNERKKSPEEEKELDLGDGDKDKEKDKFKEEKYSSKGKYHCLVTEYELDPVVLLFVRGLNDSAGFKKLLQQLDAACAKYRVRRLRAFVVFVDDAMKDFHEKDPKVRKTLDDKRDEMIAAAEARVKELKLENVVLTVGATDDLAKYELGKSALTAVLYKALRIRSSHTFAVDELAKADAPALAVLMKDVEKHLVPK